MKNLFLSSLFLASSLIIPLKGVSADELPLRASILQTDIAPFIQSEDTNQQLQSTNEVLVTTESQLDVAESNISNLQDELVTIASQLDSAESEIQSLIETCSSCMDTACESLLEETRMQLSDCDSIIDQAEGLMFDSAIPDASALDKQLSLLFSFTPYAGQNPSDPLITQIEDGLLPYLQAALENLGELNPIQKVAAGFKHTVVLTVNGKVYSCGYNNSGQLGIGNIETRISLTAMLGAGESGVIDIAAGDAHTVVLKNDGSVWATGNNQFGQLGSGDTSSTNILTAMVGTGTSDVKAIAAGSFHTVVLKEDGSAWATGLNNWGQLCIGVAPFDPMSADPSDPNFQRLTLTPMVGAGTSEVQAITAGGETPMDSGHTVILKEDGSVWAAGSNWYGQLGIEPSDPMFPTPILTAMINSGTSDVTAISAGGHHTVALKDSGAVYTTGSNSAGQLGIGPLGDQNELVEMINSGTSDVVAIDAGLIHSLVLKQDGSLYATGGNNKGQLGINTDFNANELILMPLPENTAAVTMAAGGYHSIALFNKNPFVWTTGSNDEGQLGISDPTLGKKIILTEMNPNVVAQVAVLEGVLAS